MGTGRVASAAMDIVALGRTGLQVTRIGLGMAALGRPGYVNLGHAEDLPADRDVEAMRAHAHTVLDAAHAAGVRYVDTARSYGRAEEFVASWLDARGHRDVTIGSKWGYTYTAGWRVEADQHEVKNHSLETFERQIRETRTTLGTRVQLYQIHSATLETGVLEDRAVLAALRDLDADGVVIGLTTSGPDQAATIDRALAAEVDGVNPFRCVQATWNVLEPSVGPALARAADAGWGVIVKEAVANGRLTSRGDPAVVARLEQVGGTADAAAIAAALAQPWCHVVLSGAARADHLRSNLAALAVAADDAAAALTDLAEPVESYWSRRRALDWT